MPALQAKHDSSQAPKQGSVPSVAAEQLGAPYEPPLSPDSPDWQQHVPVIDVDSKDKGTKDAWVPRDPRLERLTGRNPMNAEPHIQDLMAAGLITPPSLHYVRNHGAVPRINWSEHRIDINGLVDKPMSLSMDDVVKLPSITIPVTIVCSGNRRKELNMLKKSIGYNWGTTAASTGYWTGVRLRDLLLHAGVKQPEQGAKYVCFRGPKGELPRGEDGSYGTSMLWSKAMDTASDVLVAYKQNGRWLTPDHGFPVRMVIPGWIGGRMVKWLSEISVTSEDTENHYHVYDNRFMPSHLDEEQATQEDWWHNPDTLTTDLNVNSAIAHPAHDEVIMLSEGNTPYTVKGYAYTGCGHRITRVEVTLDGGVTWRLANVHRLEQPTAYGKYWCWCFWDVDIPRYDFFKSQHVQARAWDAAMNTQPCTLAWNVMGLMNNCMHKVLIHPHRGERNAVGVRFQHPAPVQPGKLGNIGWREEQHLQEQALEEAGISVHQAASMAGMPAPAGPVGNGEVKEPAKPGRKITMAEVEQHTSSESAWFIREGKVYDPTPFLNQHPGGADAILTVAGSDATEDFNAIHDQKAINMLKQYYIGDLVEEGQATSDGDMSKAADGPARQPNIAAEPSGSAQQLSEPEGTVALNPKRKVTLTLAERITVNHNTRLFRFKLARPDQKLGLPVGHHVMVYANSQGQVVGRPYTPISSDDDLGYMDLLIKVYFPVLPDFAGGKMSMYMDGLSVGDTIDVKGPLGHFTYDGKGQYTVHGQTKGTVTHMSMLAGGTGITPMFQVIKAVLKGPEDKTCISLVYANRTEADILLREEMDELANNNPQRFKVWYVCNTAQPGWVFSLGHITEDLMKEKLFPAGESTLGFMCGPPGLQEHVCKPGLASMGYTEKNVIIF